MSKGGKAAQRKGANGERELAAILTAAGIPASRGGTVAGKKPDVGGLMGIHCEVKRDEHLRLSAAVQQSIRDAEKFNDGLPAVFHRKNREAWLVTMTLDDWLQVYRGWRQ